MRKHTRVAGYLPSLPDLSRPCCGDGPLNRYVEAWGSVTVLMGAVMLSIVHLVCTDNPSMTLRKLFVRELAFGNSVLEVSDVRILLYRQDVRTFENKHRPNFSLRNCLVLFC